MKPMEKRRTNEVLNPLYNSANSAPDYGNDTSKLINDMCVSILRSTRLKELAETPPNNIQELYIRRSALISMYSKVSYSIILAIFNYLEDDYFKKFSIEKPYCSYTMRAIDRSLCDLSIVGNLYEGASPENMDLLAANTIFKIIQMSIIDRAVTVEEYVKIVEYWEDKQEIIACLYQAIVDVAIAFLMVGAQIGKGLESTENLETICPLYAIDLSKPLTSKYNRDEAPQYLYYRVPVEETEEKE